MDSDITITHNESTGRFEARVDGALAVCDYRRDGDVMVMFHTEVPPAARGRGVAAKLVAQALGWARAQSLHVRPTCSYVATYMRRNPATQDLLA